MQNELRNLGRTGLKCSTIGFGCYRIDDQHPAHVRSLERALSSGCNLIDTSTNYTNGGSERCVGGVLVKQLKAGLTRDKVIVVSKVGYVQGQNMDLVLLRQKQGRPYPEVVEYADGCWHCIHPDFIADQLDLSLARTCLDTMDVYLLHNPEYFFSDAKRRHSSLSLTDLRKEFYRRIEAAFAKLESLVSEGKLKHYGVSSNSFGSAADDPEMTSLTEMWACAERVSKNHHFSVIQLPLNLFESGPYLEKNNSGKTVLEVAQEKNIGVLVNRPLNAFATDRLVRLADFGSLVLDESVDTLRRSLAQLEEQFSKNFAPLIQVTEKSVSPSGFFRWAAELSHPNILRVPLEQWSQIQNEVIEPQIHYLVGELDKYFSSTGNSSFKEWQQKYLPVVTKLLKAIRIECSRNSQAASQQIAKKLDKFLPENLRKESLSRKSLAVLVNTPGVTSVLNGMRHPDYVDDALGVLSFPPFKVTPELYQQFS